jgi:putative glutamine amidotransferase
MATGRRRTRRPLIGITGPDARVAWGWWFGALAVRLAGGVPVRLTPSRPRAPRPLDGVIIGGGDDIEPRHYAGFDDGTGDFDPARDAMELRVIRRALRLRLPILGICRGSQLINVALGGNLYQDIRGRRRLTSNRGTVLPRKRVSLKRSSRLRRITGVTRLRVNSLHHQAVRQLGRGMTAVGRDLDGIIQAIEHRNGDFIIGVQWHPEYMPQKLHQRRIVAALVKAARENTG